MKDGRCVELKVGPEVFFPVTTGTAAPRKAKAVCSGCTVRVECLAYALLNRETDGVWGGMTERERRQYLKALGGNRAIRREGSVETIAEKLRLAIAV